MYLPLEDVVFFTNLLTERILVVLYIPFNELN